MFSFMFFLLFKSRSSRVQNKMVLELNISKALKKRFNSRIIFLRDFVKQMEIQVFGDQYILHIYIIFFK